jgi:hypothetical protein
MIKLPTIPVKTDFVNRSKNFLGEALLSKNHKADDVV